MELYTLYDVRAQEHMAPFVAANEIVAIRNVRVGLPQDHLARRYPVDFQLIKVALWDSVTGVVEPSYGVPVSLVSILSEEHNNG